MHDRTFPRHDVWVRAAPLGILALVPLYGAMVAGEIVAGGWASHTLGGMGVPITVVRLLIHTVITLPIAFVVGYGLVRLAPDSSPQAVAVVISLWSVFIVALQLFVYEPRVAGASALKLLFVVAPLLAGRAVAHRVRR
jgi:hypothetical protein